jgi:pyruvate/2-oxoglutarate dehydrogenase complex dihydrolipoamide dehydrogenase (E3) component
MSWDKTVDVLVVGSGAAALVAALRAAQAHATVLVIEKSDMWGGSSATSGGGIWIPNSHLAQQAGITERRQCAGREYSCVYRERASDAEMAGGQHAGPVFDDPLH